MWTNILLMVGLTILQNASFTLTSRARNSQSLMYHMLAAVLSNGLWLIVIRRVVLSLDDWRMQVAYLIGSVIGSILMHIIAMKYIERKPKRRPRT